ncbi:hypothetical protein T484DRAFT_1803462 [Baffinella frigidus]|nr:hypothetical protein T484DRAFT_1803462 [Cryptophyta sp. CCMP2293]
MGVSANSQNSPPWELHAETERRVKGFLEGCRLGGLEPHFVLDMGSESEEALGAFHTGVPYYAVDHLDAILRKEGADVIRPRNLDADDVVAKLAVQ